MVPKDFVQDIPNFFVTLCLYVILAFFMNMFGVNLRPRVALIK